MYLEKLEIQGFKSFAAKTTLTFLPPKGRRRGMTAIVGPNGSGKSNVADSLRWVLGEQSLKLLRGKKGEDVIWNGSEKRPRAGFAEVSLYLNNEDRQADIEYSEVVITRRLYRDGESEYLINKNKVRLLDIQMLLAKASFGERHYAIIGQGMIDGILLLSPEERRSFFDEATGVKPFQIKKEQAINKLKTTEENLRQAENLLAEIEPRMRSLSRAVKKLEDRESLAAELHELQHQYYGGLWHALDSQIKAEEKKLGPLNDSLSKKNDTLKKTRELMSSLEREEVRSESFLKIQTELARLTDERAKLREREFKIKMEIERAKMQHGAPTPLPLSQIISEFKNISRDIDELFSAMSSAEDLGAIKNLLRKIEVLRENMSKLITRLERPVPEKIDDKANIKLSSELVSVQELFKDLESKMVKLQRELETASSSEQQKKSSFFEAQRELQAKSDEVHKIETDINSIKIDLARLTTRREALEAEMAQELKERAGRVKTELRSDAPRGEELLPKIQKLKYQLELIGGIDPETIAEHKDTAERYEFLTKETTDLRESLNSLEKVIEELDLLIEKQFAVNFNRISDDFGRYFKILFNGGAGKLNRVKQRLDEHSDDEEETAGQVEEEPASLASKFEEQKYIIEISASPPGKRIKGMHMLSGGEKALTAIALIMAIISNQPSPFIVLDEVDAALDESNAIRFAGILEELGEKTQFIVVTHNRYTMEKATTLYGVTMGDDGISQILSVKLEDAVRA